MKNLWKDRKAGGYVLIVSVLLQIVSAVNYFTWAGAGSVDNVVIGGI